MFGAPQHLQLWGEHRACHRLQMSGKLFEYIFLNAAITTVLRYRIEPRDFLQRGCKITKHIIAFNYITILVFTCGVRWYGRMSA